MTAPALPDRGDDWRHLQQGFALQLFEDALALEAGASPRTIDAYRRDVLRCAVFMRTQGITTVGAITAAALREFIYHLKDLGLAGSSICEALDLFEDELQRLL